MSPRQILHTDNRIHCSFESVFRSAVDELIKGLRGLMKDIMGQVHFVTLKDTVENKTENMEALNLCLSTLRQHMALQIENNCKEIDHEFLIHMALSELDQSFDETRAR